MKGFEVLTTEQLKEIFANARASAIEEFLSPINTVMEKYEINTPLRIAHFLAQIGHESGELRYREEIASGKAYEGRRDLGNTEPGDGKRFKGRCLIQLTGRAIYAKYSHATGIDYVANPEKLTETGPCVDGAGWFWSDHKLNDLADQDDIRRITKRVNGGLNGFEDRKRILALAKRILIQEA